MTTYNRIFLACAALALLLSGAVALWVQPINGDLTRIGAYPERWFGWNEPQQQLAKGNDTVHDAGTGKLKILVVGDSFSAGGSWQAYLGQQYSFDFVHILHTPLPAVLEKIARDKPDAVVLESVERSLVDTYGADGVFARASVERCAPAAPAAAAVEPSFTAALALLPAFPAAARTISPQVSKSLSEGLYYLKTWLKVVIKPHKRQARVLPLRQADLFSSARSDQLLVIANDTLLKNRWQAKDTQAVHCSMAATVQTLRERGLAVALLAVPDKTTAYQDYLQDGALRTKPALINQLRLEQLPHAINMQSSLQVLIASGRRDVYLPNDTHWGYAGYQLAAVLVDKELTEQWRQL